MPTFFTINALSQASNTHIETIRFYEKIGLITKAARANNGYRQFTNQQLEELKFIKTCRSLGFELAEIKILLTLQANPNADCREANQLATQHLALVDDKIKALSHIRDLLHSMTQCTQHHVEDCLVINTIKQSQ